MPEYQLQIKQVVDYPRCRIYREFIHKLINDRSIRINGGSGLFHFTVLCSYANFRTSYRRIDGISYTVSPGEWVCTVKELSCWFRTRFHRQALSMLDTLQKQHLISYTLLGRGNVVKYKILHWARHNSALEYNAPCQKDTGFFFLPVSVALELVSSARCSEMDIVLDLWVSAVYNDTQVQGSEVGPVAYFRNGTGNPLVSYTELSCRWGLSRATVCRILKKLDGLGYISIMSFPGRHGSVIYLQNYLSTMFEISDVLIDKEEVAMTLNIHLELPETAETEESHSISEHEIIVSDALSSVSKSHIETILRKMADGEDDEAFKVHVHTDTPGEALTEAAKYGTLELAKIENMRTQAEELAAGKKAQSTDDLDAIEEELESAENAVAAPEKRYGFLAVCAGDGLAATFRDLGVDRIVSGGQTMNPSTQAILQEVNHTPSEVVFVLPNNKNIIMAAQQCVGLTEKQVIVVPTATVPQGISAMMAVDPEEPDPQAILAAMTEAAANVTTAQVTYAARNSDFDGFAINAGDYLALTDGKLFGTERELDGLLDKLAALAAEKGAEFITVFYGDGISEADARHAEQRFIDACPEAEVSLLPGGQPVYYYIISIE